MAAKIKFQPKSRMVLGMRNSLNDTHATLCIYQEYLINDFLGFLEENRERLTFRRLLAEAREYFGQYSVSIMDLNPNQYSEAEGKEFLTRLLKDMKHSYQRQKSPGSIITVS